MLAALDGIINKTEHRLIQVLRFLNFPLFCVEFYSFTMISILVLSHWDSIDLENGKFEGKPNPHFCERGTWSLMVAVMFVYLLVIVFRVAIVVGTLAAGDKETRTE